MLINRTVERLHDLRASARQLKRRAASHGPRPALVVVPSILGTRLVDDSGRLLWGSVSNLYLGRRLPSTAAGTGGVLGGFPIVPGLLSYDVFGGFLRYLERVGGYRRGDDLFVLEYDWRKGVAEVAADLEQLVDRVASDRLVDLACVSTGGLAARYYLTSPRPVRRVVYIGTPHRGAFAALSYLVDGVRVAPLGRLFPNEELARFQVVWDTLPHPDDPVFVDGRGRVLKLDLLDVQTWHRLDLPRGPDLEDRLRRARQVRETLDRSTDHPEVFVIGARHLPTLSRCIVHNDRIKIPPCSPPKRGPGLPGLFEPGDSTVSERSLLAVPGGTMSAKYVEMREHRLLPALRDVHRLVVEALLSRTDSTETHRAAR